MKFQSTPLREGRHGLCHGSKHRTGVSIHAPARGATRPSWRSTMMSTSFNPRPCARGDDMQLLTDSEKAAFQSTPLREGRRLSARISPMISLFQSTPLREGRPTAFLFAPPVPSFNPRPCARGDMERPDFLQ